MTVRVVLGVDIGTTSTKAEAFTLEGRSVAQASTATSWVVGRYGEAEMDVEALAKDVIELLARLARKCDHDVSVAAIGITGLAETGVVIDAKGVPKHAAMAWFDERGADELLLLPQAIQDSFSGVTGLALKAECSLSKLLWLRAMGLAFEPADRWLNAQEFVAMRLTGAIASEPSLASRTGLLEQRTGQPWGAVLELIGVGEGFVPELRPADTSFGTVTNEAPAVLRGACVCVAGHDHLVAAVGSGALGSNQVFNSCGTADVLVRSVPWLMDDEQRKVLVSGGLSVGRHALPGRSAILGATRFGLVLERVLTMLGAVTADDRAALVHKWTDSGSASDVVAVSEPANWVNEVTIALRDACSPEQVVSAAIDYGIRAMAPLLERMEEVVGPFDHALAGGGWSKLDGVRRAKETLMPQLNLSGTDQPGIKGAAILAGVGAGLTDYELTREVADQLAPSTHREIH